MPHRQRVAGVLLEVPVSSSDTARLSNGCPHSRIYERSPFLTLQSSLSSVRPTRSFIISPNQKPLGRLTNATTTKQTGTTNTHLRIQGGSLEEHKRSNALSPERETVMAHQAHSSRYLQHLKSSPIPWGCSLRTRFFGFGLLRTPMANAPRGYLPPNIRTGGTLA